MSGNREDPGRGRGGTLPRLLRRPLAAEGTLAGDWLRAEERARRLLPAGDPTGASDGGSTAPGHGTPPPVRDRPLPAAAFGTSDPDVADKLRRVLDGEGALVTTGQQPLLFGGPCLVLYKALTAIQTARALEEATGRPHVACFWIASDDHDWDEVGAVRLLDLENELRTLRLEPPPGWAGRPVGPAPLPEPVRALLEDLAQLLPDTEFVGIYLEPLLDAWRPGARVSTAFVRSLAAALGAREFVWLDAAARELKRAAAPFFDWAVAHASDLETALRAGTDRVEAAGYEPSVPVLDNATTVFLDTGKARERLYVDGEGVRVGRGGPYLSGRELRKRLEERPEAFSPNVSLRPVLESWALPVAATVLGPGELAYWAQLPPLFRAAGVPLPVVRPRASWTLVEGKVDKVLEKLGTEPEALADGGAAAIREQTRSSRPPEVEEAISDLRAALGGALERVEDRIGRALPGIRSAVGKARSQAFRAVHELEAQVNARVRERQEVLIGQIRKAASHLFPDGRPQERVISPLYYLTRYGPELVDALEARTAEVGETEMEAPRVAGGPGRG